MQRVDVALEMRTHFFVDVEECDSGAMALQQRIVPRPADDAVQAKDRLRIAAELELNADRLFAAKLGVGEHGHPAQRNVVRFRKFGCEIVGNAVRHQ